MIVRKKFMAAESRRSSGTEKGGAELDHAPPRGLIGYQCGLVALGALHAALDPVDRLHAGGRVDAFGGEVLDIDQIDPLEIRIVLGAAERDRLDCLMAVGKLHLNEYAGRPPLPTGH